MTFLRYDFLLRMLRASGYSINHVENVTDVGHLTSDADEGEDKLEKGARREGITAWEVAKRYTEEFIVGMQTLHIIPPTHLTKATDHIAEQIDLVRRLEGKGYTYRISDGIYFDTSKFKTYGHLARLDLKKLQAGARVEFNPEKRNHSDFALWKFSPENTHRDMEWESPWGRGFPGWHIECSAMAMKYLGDTIDIHAGGIDHIPVHHTNEIAQSEAASGKPFARYWLHANHLLSQGQKIAKSAGNGYTLADIAAHSFSPLDLRMLALQSHYRTQADFNWSNLAAAHSRLASLQAMADLRWQLPDTAVSPIDLNLSAQVILGELQNDLGTPQALARLSEIETQLEKTPPAQTQRQEFITFLQFLDELLGLELSIRSDITPAQKELIGKRAEARAQKDFAKADELRKLLTDQKIGVQDTNNGAIWYRL
jgi:cysteinyl-tRNA synthetase